MTPWCCRMLWWDGALAPFPLLELLPLSGSYHYSCMNAECCRPEPVESTAGQCVGIYLRRAHLPFVQKENVFDAFVPTLCGDIIRRHSLAIGHVQIRPWKTTASIVGGLIFNENVKAPRTVRQSDGPTQQRLCSGGGWDWLLWILCLTAICVWWKMNNFFNYLINTVVSVRV